MGFQKCRLADKRGDQLRNDFGIDFGLIFDGYEFPRNFDFVVFAKAKIKF